MNNSQNKVYLKNVSCDKQQNDKTRFNLNSQHININPLMRQANKATKTIVSLGVQTQKSFRDDLQNETVNEPVISYLAFLVDRLIDEMITDLLYFSLESKCTTLSNNFIQEYFDSLNEEIKNSKIKTSYK